MVRLTSSEETGVQREPQIQSLLADALQAPTAGCLEEAKALYLQILAMSAKTEACSGVIAYQVGSFDVAEKIIRRAIEVSSEELSIIRVSVRRCRR